MKWRSIDKWYKNTIVLICQAFRRFYCHCFLFRLTTICGKMSMQKYNDRKVEMSEWHTETATTTTITTSLITIQFPFRIVAFRICLNFVVLVWIFVCVLCVCQRNSVWHQFAYFGLDCNFTILAGEWNGMSTHLWQPYNDHHQLRINTRMRTHTHTHWEMIHYHGEMTMMRNAKLSAFSAQITSST